MSDPEGAAMTETELPVTFERRLSALINEYSLENGSDTPDFILAAYLNDCLQAYNRAAQSKVRWGF